MKHFRILSAKEAIVNYRYMKALYDITMREYAQLKASGDMAVLAAERISVSEGHISRPVETYVAKLDYLRHKMIVLDTYIFAVECLVDSLSKGGIAGFDADPVMLEILVSHYWQKQPLKKIARRNSMTEKTVSSLKKYMLKTMEKIIKDVRASERKKCR